MQGEHVAAGAVVRRVQMLRVAAVLAATLLVPALVVVGVSAASTPAMAYRMTVEITIHHSRYQPSALTVPVACPCASYPQQRPHRP